MRNAIAAFLLLIILGLGVVAQAPTPYVYEELVRNGFPTGPGHLTMAPDSLGCITIAPGDTMDSLTGNAWTASRVVRDYFVAVNPFLASRNFPYGGRADGGVLIRKFADRLCGFAVARPQSPEEVRSMRADLETAKAAEKSIFARFESTRRTNGWLLAALLVVSALFLFAVFVIFKLRRSLRDSEDELIGARALAAECGVYVDTAPVEMRGSTAAVQTAVGEFLLICPVASQVIASEDAEAVYLVIRDADPANTDDDGWEDVDEVEVAHPPAAQPTAPVTAAADQPVDCDACDSRGVACHCHARAVTAPTAGILTAERGILTGTPDILVREFPYGGFPK